MSHKFRTQAIILCLMWTVYAIIVIPLWGWTYWDFGDGNYLYVGRRILDGLVPYRDILAPQPPLHLLGSAAAQAIGSALFDSALIGARAYALLLRFLASLMVYLCTYRLFGCRFRAVVSAAVYLAMPIGFWWSICIQSENIELVFLLLAFWQIMYLEKRAVIIAGIASALAMHCNMTAVPYMLCNMLFLLVRRPRLFLWYAPVTLAVWGAGAFAAYAWAGAPYMDNVVLNQVGSFPREELLGYSPLIYFKNKVLREGGEVLRLEGPLIAAALAAMAVSWGGAFNSFERKSDEYRRFEYGAWYSIGMLLSIGFVMKGGTMNYIFVLGEPATAIFGADALVRLFRLLSSRSILFFIQFFLRAGTPRAAAISWLAFIASGILILVIVAWPFAWQNIQFTRYQVQSELHEEDLLAVVELIEKHTNPGDPILAPPFYAWASDRTVAAELAENYLWQIKWANESHDEIEGEGVMKMEELARMLRRREVPLVLLDVNLTGRVPDVRNAVLNYYIQTDPGIIQSRNTQLAVFVPASN